ncbi:Putative halogenase [Burkholderia gladioli]|uniref:NAD(P)/FAD-dependent oxidoreductase n=1 Tax=Burkholderia gladioli TaxID=28095 RepID=UPI00163E72DB|nr:NAD(P)/FAD-dependent oxidoreductase [Burkholderia gladioli]CAG9238136.1 Putative halogenase [Burkholderia gladioli]
MNRRVQVLVIGGGPGGSTAAALLAKAGQDVLLLERDTFPRYHIGESLLASCQATLKLSGAYEAVAAHGFQVKRGALIHWGDDEWVLDWRKLVDQDAWSWQVDRATYDDILLRNASRQGVEVVEGATVKRILFEGARAVAAQWMRAGEGELHTVEFDYVIDASGRHGLLSQQHFDMRQQHEVFRNVAVWSYWSGAQLLPNSPEGAINVVSAPDGWWWHIPLGKERYSVGMVTHRNAFLRDRPGFDSLDAYYHDRLRQSPAIHGVTAGASQVASVKVEQDYSYVSQRFCGPGYLIVGDAACFLDPLLSTGVHLAQYSAMIAAATIISVSKREIGEAEGWTFFEYIYRRAYTRMLVLVSRMYQSYKGRDEYFWSAQKLVHESTHHHEPVRSFTDISAGLSDLHEASDIDTRALTRQLLEAAEAEQDAKAAKVPTTSLHTLDLSVSWGPWRSLEGADTTLQQISLVTQPSLGLRRNAPGEGS